MRIFACSKLSIFFQKFATNKKGSSPVSSQLLARVLIVEKVNKVAGEVAVGS